MPLPPRQQALPCSKSAPVPGHLGGHRAPRFFQQIIRTLKARRDCTNHKRFLAFGAYEQFKQVHKEWPEGHAPFRFGKKDAGRLLDGRVWDEMPGVNNEP